MTISFYKYGEYFSGTDDICAEKAKIRNGMDSLID